jgi:hypothetical protein
MREIREQTESHFLLAAVERCLIPWGTGWCLLGVLYWLNRARCDDDVIGER